MTVAPSHSATAPLQFPSTPLQPTAEVVDAITKALLQARDDVRSFAAAHTPDEYWKINQYALRKMKWPPNGDAQAAELQLMHRIADTRTPDGIKTAQWYSAQGLDAAWDEYLAQYTRTVGPREARRATKLLHDTLDMVNDVTQVAKAAAGRKRPYDTDPTLTVAIDKPGGSPSYPSGHTSAAFAAAIVLGHLMPNRAQELWISRHRHRLRVSTAAFTIRVTLLLVRGSLPPLRSILRAPVILVQHALSVGSAPRIRRVMPIGQPDHPA